jgi:hypothetical protein
MSTKHKLAGFCFADTEKLIQRSCYRELKHRSITFSLLSSPVVVPMLVATRSSFTSCWLSQPEKDIIQWSSRQLPAKHKYGTFEYPPNTNSLVSALLIQRSCYRELKHRSITFSLLPSPVVVPVSVADRSSFASCCECRRGWYAAAKSILPGPLPLSSCWLADRRRKMRLPSTEPLSVD